MQLIFYTFFPILNYQWGCSARHKQNRDVFPVFLRFCARCRQSLLLANELVIYSFTIEIYFVSHPVPWSDGMVQCVPFITPDCPCTLKQVSIPGHPPYAHTYTHSTDMSSASCTSNSRDSVSLKEDCCHVLPFYFPKHQIWSLFLGARNFLACWER